VNPTPILFLDIDDVLCLHQQYSGLDAIGALEGRLQRPHQAAHVFSQLFAPGPSAALRQVHDALGGRLRYVISSTWREFMGRADLCLLFDRGGLDFVAAAMHEADRWCTPGKFGRGQRIDEIAAWLDRHHRGEPFAIVDDTYSGASLWPALAMAHHPFHGRVVLCPENVGLRDTDVQTLVDALARSASLAHKGEG
jgi:hypothetical protein